MTGPARHSAWGAYLLVWLTGGLFWFVWLHRMMRDLNTIHGRTLFDQRRITRWGAGGFLLYAVVLALAMAMVDQRSSYWQMLMGIGFLLAMGCMAAWVWLHLRIARAIALLQPPTADRARISPIVAGLLAWVLGLAVPYLQAHLNSSVSREGES